MTKLGESIGPIWNWLIIIPLVLSIWIALKCWPWAKQVGDYNTAFDHYFTMIAPMVIGAIFTLLVTAGIAGIAAGISSVIQSRTAMVWHPCWNAKMVSLRNADGIQGSISGGIFIFSGKVESQQVYFYYTVNKDGSFQSHKWEPDDDTKIYEEDRLDGEIHQYDTQLKNKWMAWFTEPNDRLKMEFHIPKGSLRQSFSLQ